MQPDKIMHIDLECENNPYFGAIASPRHPDNYVVANGYAIDSPTAIGPVEWQYYDRKEDAGDWLHIPDDVWLLVAHNAPFELDWMLATQREKIMAFLARGGRVYCTAYAEYLLTNQQHQYPALDDVAPKYGGTHKIDGIKILWEQGTLTSAIDKALLLEYLTGPSGDVENTRRIFYGQYAELTARGMFDMFMLRMDGMIYNTLAMDAGLFVDGPQAEKQLADQNIRLAELQTSFRCSRAGVVPDFVEFKESSDYHMSAWLFGGPIKYRIQDVWYEDDGVTPKYQKDACYKFGEGVVSYVPVQQFADHENPALAFELCVRHYGDVDRYKAGKNKGLPKEHQVESDKPKLRWYDRVHVCAPLVDLNLLGEDMAAEFKREHAGARTLADGSPVYSTGKDAIEMLSKRVELPLEVRAVLTDLMEFAKLDKDIGTYYIRKELNKDGTVKKVSGMLQYLTPYSVVHHVLNCTSTVTTRLSSNRPNMQNIPRGDTSDVKAIFTSRFNSPVWLAWAKLNGLIDEELFMECMNSIAKGESCGKIIEADYSALEVVTLAAFSKDKNLGKALLDGIDMHCMRLAQQLGESYEDVLLKCKDGNHPEHKRYKKMRTEIKPKAFAYQYGATARGIAYATGCTVEEAQAFIDAEKALFPDVERFYDEGVIPLVERSAVNRREQLDEGRYRLYQVGYWESPGHTRYEFRTFPKFEWVDGVKYEVMKFKPTQIRNYPIQGESGYFVQGIAGQVMRWLVSKNFFGGRVWIINQVHDALYFDCHVSVLQEVCATVKAIMESLPQMFNQYGYDLNVPFPAEVEYGDNMRDKTKFH